MPVQRHVIYACPGNIVNISILASLLPSIFSDSCVTRKPIPAAKSRQHPLSCSASSECLIWTPCFFEWSPPLHKIIAHKKTLYAIRNIRQQPQKIIAPSQKANHNLQNAKRHLQQNINTYYRNRMHDPKTPDMWAKTPPRRHKTKHVFYQNATTSSITYGFFHRNTLFSACIIENATRSTAQNTKYKANKQELSGLILTPRLSLPHSFRCAHAKKTHDPYVGQICQTGITK